MGAKGNSNEDHEQKSLISTEELTTGEYINTERDDMRQKKI